MRTTLHSGFLVATFLVFITSCSSSETSTSADKNLSENVESVIKTIEDLEPEVKSFNVSATKSSIIDLKNGGSIEIPAGAFVTEEGKPVSGEVEIKWSEFHSLGEIALSGIPMAYDSAGVQSDLISGGMFRIYGEQKGEDVKIAPNKSLKINLASSNPQESMNFYELNEKTGEWKYETTKKAEPIPGLPVQDEEIVEIKQPYNLTLNVKFDAKQYPELKADEILSWEVPANELDDEQINALKGEIVKAEIADNASKGNYKLKLQGKKFNYQVNARPVTFDNPPSNSKTMKAQIKKDVEDSKDYETKLANNDIIRSISISGFGTYNWDCMDTEKAVFANVEMDIPNSNDEKYSSYFLVSPKSRRIFPIQRKDRVRLSALIPACIIAITKNKEVFTVRNMMLDDVRKQPNAASHKLKMKKTGYKIKNSKDLDGIIQKCI